MSTRATRSTIAAEAALTLKNIASNEDQEIRMEFQRSGRAGDHT